MKIAKPECVKTPWYAYLEGIPAHLDYQEGTMIEAMEKVAAQNPDLIAYDFMGTPTTYADAVADIAECARALRAAGVRENDRVTIAMPNAGDFDVLCREHGRRGGEYDSSVVRRGRNSVLSE